MAISIPYNGFVSPYSPAGGGTSDGLLPPIPTSAGAAAVAAAGRLTGSGGGGAPPADAWSGGTGRCTWPSLSCLGGCMSCCCWYAGRGGCCVCVCWRGEGLCVLSVVVLLLPRVMLTRERLVRARLPIVAKATPPADPTYTHTHTHTHTRVSIESTH